MTIDLEHLVDLIRGVEIENSISWQPRELIGFIADKILVADKQGVSTYLEGINDRVIHPELDAVAGYRRNSIARHDRDIAVSIGKRAVGADLQGIKETRIHERISGAPYREQRTAQTSQIWQRVVIPDQASVSDQVRIPEHEIA